MRRRRRLELVNFVAGRGKVNDDARRRGGHAFLLVLVLLLLLPRGVDEDEEVARDILGRLGFFGLLLVVGRCMYDVVSPVCSFFEHM